METYQINKICRCCLQCNGQMKPLYGFSLDAMLHSLADLKVEPEDGLPGLICFQCVLQLSRAFRFKTQCQKSNSILLEIIKNVRSKTQRDDEDLEIFCDEKDDQNVSNDEQSLEKLPITAVAEVEITDVSCPTCGKVYDTRKKLVRHVKSHKKEKLHKCFDCVKEFSQSGNLKMHQLLKHKDPEESNSSLIKEHSCSICGKTFKYAGSLFKHNKIHTGNNILHCPSCPKYFLENTTLKNHLRTHTGDRPFVCPHCDKTFTNSSNFNRHIRSHGNSRPFACNICKRTFTERYYLKNHMNTHDGKKSVLCSDCGKCLANVKSLNVHMRLHTDYKIYKCGFENCYKSFSRRDTLTIHRRIHAGEKPYSCDKCGVGFKTKNQLSLHLKTHEKLNPGNPNNGSGLVTEDAIANIYSEEEKRKMIEESLLLFSLNEHEECVFLPS